MPQPRRGRDRDAAAPPRGRPPGPGAARPSELERRVRAYRPWPGTFLEALDRARSSCSGRRSRPASPATCRAARPGRRLRPGAGDGRRPASLLELPPAGGRRMDGATFLRGRPGSSAPGCDNPSPDDRNDRPGVAAACPASSARPAPRRVRRWRRPRSPPGPGRARRARVPRAPGGRRGVALGGGLVGRRDHAWPAAARRARRARSASTRSTETEIRVADDGATEKALHRLSDGRLVESVLMHYPARGERRERNTLCISSQAGCAVGCPFCATGELGFERDLGRRRDRRPGPPRRRRLAARRPTPHQRRVHGHGRAAAQPRCRARGSPSSSRTRSASGWAPATSRSRRRGSCRGSSA